MRIIRACREMGARAVAVYSEADRAALHVRMADEAYPIGPAPARESYLSIEKIIETAKRCGAGAIHPGYGFLAENPRFAEACEAAGITFIGPPAEAIKLMGDKTTARRAMVEAGVPVVPGEFKPLTLHEAREAARRLGYPVLLKAAAGGGGKGMRLVGAESELAAAYRDAASEAEAAFGDPALYLEKYLTSPRHIEIQVLADNYGNIVHLGERECSLQRRHQKVLEEAPSPLVDEKMRAAMGAAAVRAAAAAGYRNAGTVEFIVDAERNFYFLEMNTRLQVEHPITEMITGIDIVKEQFKIAAGERLNLRQDDIKLSGAAIECRIYAEDPENNFYPSPGKITFLVEPHGPGIRCDSGVYQGCEIPLFYDPLIAKLIAHGSSRAEAIERMRRALSEYRVGGIKSNIPFFQELLEQAGFLAGSYHTGTIGELLERKMQRRASGGDAAVLRQIAAIGAAIAFCENGKRAAYAGARAVAESSSRWKEFGRLRALRTK